MHSATTPSMPIIAGSPKKLTYNSNPKRHAGI
jgi:hypothetical protein